MSLLCGLKLLEKYGEGRRFKMALHENIGAENIHPDDRCGICKGTGWVTDIKNGESYGHPCATCWGNGLNKEKTQ